MVELVVANEGFQDPQLWDGGPHIALTHDMGIVGVFQVFSIDAHF